MTTKHWASLFTALDTATGEAVGLVEFLKFLRVIDRSVPKDVEVHLVLDHHSTHRTALIHNRLLRHPRFHLHFTPTSASWLNLVERWFAKLASDQRSTKELKTAITQYLEVYNEDPRPFIWAKSADEILEFAGTYGQ